jgi:hypothetical protein
MLIFTADHWNNISDIAWSIGGVVRWWDGFESSSGYAVANEANIAVKPDITELVSMLHVVY